MFHRNRTVMGSMAWTALLFLLSAISLTTAANTEKQTYIVHMKHAARPQSYTNHRDWYSSSLHSLTSAASDSFLYTYDAAFQGFSATLSPHEAEILRRSDSVVGVYEDTVYTLHTTRSPHFLGLDENIEYFDGHNSLDIDQASTDIIIGVVDSGVWPESRSFDDSGMPEIPARWKGDCESGPDFSPDLCNKKLIGTRFFSKGYRTATGGNPKDVESPRDRDGHGTHTASTAAGSPVANASLFGYASGTARGMATRARVAMYKVCWSDGCFTSDILAGLDRAISDGVDVLSISLGSSSSAPYYHDTIAIGTFTAVEKGIFVSCSAGNEGPAKATLSNVAPWVMTIGAGTLDRDFPAYGLLGNKKRFTGASVYSGPGMGDEPVKLVYDERNSSSKMCLPGSLEPELVRGKVAVCDAGYVGFVEKGMVVRNAGGVGMVIATANGGAKGLVAESYMLPAMMIGKKEGDMIKEYTRSDPNPSVVLSFRGATLNVQPSPLVAGFSSRGPNVVTPQILKPDIIGPGVNILAAWSEAVGPSGLEIDSRKTTFNIMSGTSMSSPHISGIAALLKAARPDWSPSAIKSALMTTAYNLDNTRSPLQDAAAGAGAALSNPWAHGSGYVNPRKALYPGLVYDISTDDYVTFLCSLNYTIGQVRAIVKRPNISCSSKFDDPGELNYPSFSVVFAKKTAVRYTRELTNVGAAPSVYEVAVTAPPTVKVTVKPAELVFRKVGDKCRCRVTFVAKNAANPPGPYEFGSIVWRNAQHQVRSPFALAWI